MAQGSERPSWAWSKERHCAGCGMKPKLTQVRCWHYANGKQAIFCGDCFPDKWKEWMHEANRALRYGTR